MKRRVNGKFVPIRPDLLDAVRRANLADVNACILAGANPNTDNPLHIAATFGSDAIASSLLAAHADPSRLVFGKTALYQASDSASIAVVTTLLDVVGLVNLPNADGKTPVWAAAENGNPTVLKQLLEANGSPNGVVDGTTPLLVAARAAKNVYGSRHADCLYLLLGAHADTRHRHGTTGATALLEAVNGFARATMPRKELQRVNYLSVCEVLLTGRLPNGQVFLPIDVNTPTFDGETPLYHAAWRGKSEDLIRLLLKRFTFSQADVNMVSPVKRQTALWIAARTGQGSVVRILLEHGADPTLANYEGISPLAAATKIAHADPAARELLILALQRFSDRTL